MTMAVCLMCGEIKFGALLPCAHCGKKPVGTDEAAKSLVFSDHHYNKTALEAISNLIKEGYDVFELMPELKETAEEYTEMIDRMADPEYRREFIAQFEHGSTESDGGITGE